MTGLGETAAAPRRSWHDDLPVALLAATAGGAVWAVARLAGVEVEVRSGAASRPVGAVSVVVTAVVVTLVAGVLLRTMVWRMEHGLRWWTVVALGVLAASLVGPASAETGAAGAALVAMHVTVAAVVVVGLRHRAVA